MSKTQPANKIRIAAATKRKLKKNDRSAMSFDLPSSSFNVSYSGTRWAEYSQKMIDKSNNSYLNPNPKSHLIPIKLNSVMKLLYPNQSNGDVNHWQEHVNKKSPNDAYMFDLLVNLMKIESENDSVVNAFLRLVHFTLGGKYEQLDGTSITLFLRHNASVNQSKEAALLTGIYIIKGLSTLQKTLENNTDYVKLVDVVILDNNYKPNNNVLKFNFFYAGSQHSTKPGNVNVIVNSKGSGQENSIRFVCDKELRGPLLKQCTSVNNNKSIIQSLKKVMDHIAVSNNKSNDLKLLIIGLASLVGCDKGGNCETEKAASWMSNAMVLPEVYALESQVMTITHKNYSISYSDDSWAKEMENGNQINKDINTIMKLIFPFKYNGYDKYWKQIVADEQPDNSELFNYIVDGIMVAEMRALSFAELISSLLGKHVAVPKKDDRKLIIMLNYIKGNQLAKNAAVGTGFSIIKGLAKLDQIQNNNQFVNFNESFDSDSMKKLVDVVVAPYPDVQTHNDRNVVRVLFLVNFEPKFQFAHVTIAVISRDDPRVVIGQETYKPYICDSNLLVECASAENKSELIDSLRQTITKYSSKNSKREIVEMGMIIVALGGLIGSDKAIEMDKKASAILSDMYQYLGTKDKAMYTMRATNSALWKYVFTPGVEFTKTIIPKFKNVFGDIFKQAK